MGLAARKLRMTKPAGGFVPTDIAGLTLWLDASDAVTITASGSNVTSWADKSSNSYALTAYNSPQTGTRTVNSLNAVDLSGTNQHLYATNAPVNNASDGSWTVFAVCVPDVVTGTQSILDADQSRRVGQLIRIDGSTSQSIGFTSGVSPTTDSGGSVSSATAVLLRSVNTGTLVEIFVDGASSGGTSAASQAYYADAIFGVGSYGGGAAQFFNGLIAEVVAYDSDLAAGDVADVETYLADKWGITL